MKTKETKERIQNLNENLDPELLEGDVELIIPEGLGKDLKKEIKSVSNASRQEIRCLVDNFYQIQEKRIALQGQIRAIRQEADDLEAKTFADILEWQLKTQLIQEKGLKDALNCICQTSEVGKWLMSIKGIGPTLAAGLLAYFDVTGIEYATHFMSYAGLNDNNRPWLGREKTEKIINEVLGHKKDISDDDLIEIANRTQWSVTYLNNACSKYNEDGSLKSRSKSDLVKAASKIPYNKDLKVLMFKIGESFVKVANRDSLYGKLILERKAYESAKNETGEYAEQAARILATKKIGKDTDAYKAYSQGKLPKAHIQRRAVRWATKIFVSHVFDEMYRVANNKKPAEYYILGKDKHKDYIAPEIPFTRQF